MNYTWPRNSRIGNWTRLEFALDTFDGKCSNCCPLKCSCCHRHRHIWNACRSVDDHRPRNRDGARESSDSTAAWTICRWRTRQKLVTSSHTNCRVDRPICQSATKIPAACSPRTWPRKMWSSSGDGSPPANWCRQTRRRRLWDRPVSLFARAICVRHGIRSSGKSTRRTSTTNAT